MRGLPLYVAAFTATVSVGLLSMVGTADPRDSDARGIVGPDVVTWYAGDSGGLDMEHYGSSDGINAYAFGTTSCNWGDQEATWGSQGNESYPVIAQNCYRLANGRFEQIGTSWLKHSFCAVSEPGCGSCQSTPCSTLGIGCADTYWAGLNADATAPRSEINAYTGEYSYPFSISPSGPSWSRGRLLIATADISDSDALYFIEGQYICSDEAYYNNQWNNCSWRQVQFNSITNPDDINQTQVADPAIFAWKVHDPGVDLQMVQVPSDGRLHLGARAYDNGDGTWDYEYAVHNMNSHRSVGTFTVPVGSATVSAVGFHDADYHSGEVIDTADWTWEQVGNDLVFSTDSYDENEWANAIRWGSVYNFRFTADTGPDEGVVEFGVFRPGSPDSVTAQTLAPLGTPPSLVISYPDGLPDLLDPNGGTTVAVVIASGTSDPVSGTAMLHWSADSQGDSVAMEELGNSEYLAVFPSLPCGAAVSWYISVQGSDGNTVYSPASAPDSTWAADAWSGFETVYEDDFESDLGWDVGGDATDGQWERGLPAGGGERCDPPVDGDGSGSCYVTDNVEGNSDVDGGITTLTSPIMDASSSPTLSYWRWYNNGSTCGSYSVDDTFEVDFSTDGGQSWLSLETVGPGDSGASGGWFLKEFDLGDVPDFVATDQFRVRFMASDYSDGSIVEAGIDGVQLVSAYCDVSSCSADVSNDGTVGVEDLLAVIGAWGACKNCDEDIDENGLLNVADLLAVIGAWGPCP